MNVAISLVVHLLGVVMWVGGLLAMSRVMVLHAKERGPSREVLSLLEGKFHIFALVGAVLALLSGLYQLSEWPAGLFRQSRWMHHKLTALLLLAATHATMWSVYRKWRRLGPDAPLSRGQASGLHGTVGMLLIVIVALVFIGRMR
jgi:uncharacterized membrane protein